MGFLELAAALKFISNADLVFRTGLTRPMFLAVWFGIFAVAGLYMLGWLKLPHDPGAKIGPARRSIGLATFAGSFYLLAAIEGAPLWQKRLFLAALFGAEMTTPAPVSGHGTVFGSPTLGMNKRKRCEASGRRFLEKLEAEFS